MPKTKGLAVSGDRTNGTVGSNLISDLDEASILRGLRCALYLNRYCSGVSDWVLSRWLRGLLKAELTFEGVITCWVVEFKRY